jgi:uncharacterized phage-associated protein
MTLQLIPGYDVRKAAHVSAFFALKQGGAINVLKLSKLLYLAERDFIERYDAPMFYDDLASLPDGPVTSITLNLINGDLEHEEWSKIVGPRSGYNIPAQQNVTFKHLDELSRADLAILDSLWERFGSWDRYKLRDWTHDPKNIPEWKNPMGSSLPIHHEELFGFLKKERVAVLVEDIKERRAIAKAMSADI